jgi:itaconyl-CoA hydratase
MTIHQPYVGKYFEDFAAGDIYKHWPGRTISEVDNTWFTLLTMNKHPVHFDHNYAAGQMFGKPLVNSTLTLSIVVGMSVWDTSQAAIANLGWENIKLPKPVFIGDTLYAESEILETRESKSRPDSGILSFETRGYNQKNELVISYRRSILIKRRGYDDGKLPAYGTPESK